MMTIGDVVKELANEAGFQEVIVDTGDGIYEIAELKFDRVNQNVVIVIGDEIEYEDEEPQEGE